MKIGIITHYYKSENYGGNLQAYALCEYINKDLKLDAEQISYIRRPENILKYWLWKIRSYIKNYKNILILSDLKKRRRAILKFNRDMIKHSTPYTNSNISEANDVYDVFITGSDQVWHPNAVCPAYLLDFVRGPKKKLSYAASLAVDSIPNEKRKSYKDSLMSFDAISVRENNAVELLEELTGKRAECVLDPTLLLSRDDWDQICQDCNIGEKYIFAYFLGDSQEHRNVVEAYAKKRNLKIVSLPNLLGKFRKCDGCFGDYRLYDISPSQFIGLIKNSEVVFTDSFHAGVFSIIYRKEFFVFERKTKNSMNSRIYTLTDMFDLKERFCDTNEKISCEYIESLQPIDYDRNFQKYDVAKENSRKFLAKNLGKCENEG